MEYTVHCTVHSLEIRPLAEPALYVWALVVVVVVVEVVVVIVVVAVIKCAKFSVNNGVCTI